ncbi:MAG: hypothetical protein R2883_00380 [Caldisericia bacterium]
MSPVCIAGSGEVTAETARNGSPARSAGKTYIGKSFNNENWISAITEKPTGLKFQFFQSGMLKPPKKSRS